MTSSSSRPLINSDDRSESWRRSGMARGGRTSAMPWGGLAVVPKSRRRLREAAIFRRVCRYRPDESIAATRQRFDPALAARLLTERFAQSRDLHRQVALLDHEPGPGRLHQHVLGDGRARLLDQDAQQRDGPLTDGRRLIAAKQDFALVVQSERSKRIDRRH